MFDASSKISNGLMEGNVLDLGNYEECLAIEDTFENKTILGRYCGLGVIITIPRDKLPINVRKSSFFEHNLERFRQSNYDIDFNIHINIDELQVIPIILSVCLPDSCYPSDFNLIAKILTAIAQDYVEGTKITLNDQMCQTKNDTPKIDKYVILGM